MVEKTAGMLTLDFPADELKVLDIPDLAVKALGTPPVETLMGKSDFLLVYEREAEIRAMKPDFRTLIGMGHRGVIVTAPGEEVDFVSRCFFPQSGIDEDPVTGSAHTTLTPYWSKRLGKKQLRARQLSSRGGGLWCEDCGERIRISGHAITYLVGEITM